MSQAQKRRSNFTDEPVDENGMVEYTPKARFQLEEHARSGFADWAESAEIDAPSWPATFSEVLTFLKACGYDVSPRIVADLEARRGFELPSDADHWMAYDALRLACALDSERRWLPCGVLQEAKKSEVHRACERAEEDGDGENYEMLQKLLASHSFRQLVQSISEASQQNARGNMCAVLQYKLQAAGVWEE
jgi:hypothetical protein